METPSTDDLMGLISHKSTDDLLPSDNLKPGCQLKMQLFPLVRPLKGVSRSFTRVIICGCECGIQCYGAVGPLLKGNPLATKMWPVKTGGLW